jgi:hypothetical protein
LFSTPFRQAGAGVSVGPVVAVGTGVFVDVSVGVTVGPLTTTVTPVEGVVLEELAVTVIELNVPPACAAGIRTSNVKSTNVPCATSIDPGFVAVQPDGRPVIEISKTVSVLLLLVSLMVIVAI